MSTVVNPALADTLRELGAFDPEVCMNCGVCTATCPLGIDVLPRHLLRYAALGMEERLRAETETVFSCLLCRACEESCPAGVHITENIRVMRRWLLEEGMLMSLPMRDVVGILGDNLRLRGSVLPISARKATRWTQGLELPRGGETVLYTGQMYQLIPYIERLVGSRAAPRRLAAGAVLRAGAARQSSSSTSRRSWAGRRSRSARSTTAFHVGSSASCATRASSSAACMKTTCTRERSPTTSGSTSSSPCTLGVCARTFVKHGVKNVITIDPHTTNMLRTVYPTLLDEYDVTVRSYLEVLADHEQPATTESIGQIALHDSCVYARHEGIVEEPRTLLAGAGLEVLEPRNAGRLTWCCGGPAESLYPDKALATARKRVEQVQAVSTECVTMCPLCLVNLSKAAGGTVHVPGHLRGPDRGARAPRVRLGRESVETAATAWWCVRMWC